MIVAIDGPAGAGKSTVARALAERLGIRVLDSGAVYRAAAWRAAGAADPVAALRSCRITFEADGVRDRICVDGRDVTDEIRSAELSRAASELAQHEGVRAIVVSILRERASHDSFVVEGRDIGTVVFPDAEAKFFLDADLEERAKRRTAELSGGGDAERRAAVRAELDARDERDRRRAVAPLAAAVDAIRVDSTGRAVGEVVETMLAEIARRGLAGTTSGPVGLTPEQLLDPQLGTPTWGPMPAWADPFWTWMARFGRLLIGLWHRPLVAGLEHLPPHGPFIVAVNHVSFLDPVLVGALLRGTKLRFMAKSELFRIPLLGSFIRALGAFPVRRGQRDTDAMRTALWLLVQPDPPRAVLMFPEGTRSRAGRMGPLRPGIGRLVLWSGAAVVPVFLDGTFRSMPPGAWIPRPWKIRMFVGPPLRFDDLRARGASRENFQAVAARVGRAIAALCPRGASEA